MGPAATAQAAVAVTRFYSRWRGRGEPSQGSVYLLIELFPLTRKFEQAEMLEKRGAVFSKPCPRTLTYRCYFTDLTQWFCRSKDAKLSKPLSRLLLKEPASKTGWLRTYFTLRRYLGGAYLALLQFFLNYRRFMRSRVGRQGKSPRELITGQKHPYWFTLLGLGKP